MAVSGSVTSHALGNAQLVTLGGVTLPASIAGTVVASLPGQTTVTASLIGTVTAQGVLTHGANFTTIAPLPTGGRAFTVNSDPVAVDHDDAVTGLFDLQGRFRTRVDTGTIIAVQSGPWAFTGSAQVTQATSPWICFGGSSGQFIGFVVASQVGQAFVTASCVGQQFVTASLVGQPTVTASCVGQQFVTTSLVGVPTVAASAFVQGMAAHDAPVVGNPVLTGATAATSGDFTAITASGDVVRLIADLYGKQIIHLHATPENWVSAVTSTIGVTADQLLLTGAGAGVRYYVTDVMVTAVAYGSDVAIKDSGGTLWRGMAAGSGGGFAKEFKIPIRGTANSSLVAACLTVSAGAIFNVSGFKAP